MSAVKFGKDGSARPVIDVQEVNTAADADKVQVEVVNGEVLPDERPQKPNWSPVRKSPGAPAPVTNALAQRNAARSRIDTDDNINLGEIQIPTLNIVQGVGDLSTKFDAGAVVFDKRSRLAKPPEKGAKGNPESSPPVELIVVGFRPTRWAEKIAGGEQGRIVNTEETVYEIGGTTDYGTAYQNGELVVPFFQPLATALVMVRCTPLAAADDPAAVEELFPFECPGDNGEVIRYNLGAWHLRGTGYTNAAKPLKTHRKLGGLKAGYMSKVALLTTTLRKFGANVAYIPIVKLGAATTEAQRKLVTDVLDSLTNTPV